MSSAVFPPPKKKCLFNEPAPDIAAGCLSAEEVLKERDRTQERGSIHLLGEREKKTKIPNREAFVGGGGGRELHKDKCSGVGGSSGRLRHLVFDV